MFPQSSNKDTAKVLLDGVLLGEVHATVDVEGFVNLPCIQRYLPDVGQVVTFQLLVPQSKFPFNIQLAHSGVLRWLDPVLALSSAFEERKAPRVDEPITFKEEELFDSLGYEPVHPSYITIG